MKHPALARIFAIVLAIMSVLMLLNGALGFGKASNEYQDVLNHCQYLDDKLATYIELDTNLKNSISYDEAYAELEKLQEQHDSDAAQHRTDLATHTATRGGYVLGADMIWDGKQQLAAAKAELEAGKQTLAEKEEQFNQLMTAFNTVMPLLEKAIEMSSGSQEEFQAAIASIDAAIAMIDTILGMKPQPPEVPTVPELPTPPEDADEETKAAYAQALEIYNKLLEEYNKALEEYEGNLAGWQEEYNKILGEVITSMGAAAGKIQSGSDMLNAALSQLPADVLDDLGNLAGSDIDIPDFSNMSLEEIRAALVQLRAYLVSAGSVPAALQNALNSLQAQISEGQAAINTAKAQIVLGEKALEKAEFELQHQLELLWYNMGKLEDEESELEDEKLRLDDEANMLDKMLISADEQKELENKHRSARIVLMQENDIKTMVNNGGDLIDSSTAYIQECRARAQHNYHGLLFINILAVLGGIFGILSVPVAFEKLRSRLLLILLPALCLLCAIGADGLNMYLGLGQMYTALAAAIFALLCLLVVFPKDKSIQT